EHNSATSRGGPLDQNDDGAGADRKSVGGDRTRPGGDRGAFMQRAGQIAPGRRLSAKGGPFYDRHSAYAELGQAAADRPRLYTRGSHQTRVCAQGRSGKGGGAV